MAHALHERALTPTRACVYPGTYNDFAFFGLEVIVRFCLLSWMVLWLVVAATVTAVAIAE